MLSWFCTEGHCTKQQKKNLGKFLRDAKNMQGILRLQYGKYWIFQINVSRNSRKRILRAKRLSLMII